MLAPALIPTLVLPRRVLHGGVRLWVRGTNWMLRHVVGTRIEICGRENIPEGGAIIAAKHQSEWEASIFLLLLRDPVYVMKRELAFIPLYGLYSYKMGMIIIDRAGRARTLRKLVRQARKVVAQGRALVIFPEGTRVSPGERRPYHSGVAALYSELGVPVVPVVHNSGLHWPKNTYRKYPGTIVLRFLPAIPPGLKRHEFMTRLQNTMERASDELLAECAGGPATEAGRRPVAG